MKDLENCHLETTPPTSIPVSAPREGLCGPQNGPEGESGAWEGRGRADASEARTEAPAAAGTPREGTDGSESHEQPAGAPDIHQADTGPHTGTESPFGGVLRRAGASRQAFDRAFDALPDTDRPARHTADTITPDTLDALYQQLEDAEALAEQHARNTMAVARERETYRKAWREAQRMRAKRTTERNRHAATVARVTQVRDRWTGRQPLPSPAHELLAQLTDALDGGASQCSCVEQPAADAATEGSEP